MPMTKRGEDGFGRDDLCIIAVHFDPCHCLIEYACSTSFLLESCSELADKCLDNYIPMFLLLKMRNAMSA